MNYIWIFHLDIYVRTISNKTALHGIGYSGGPPWTRFVIVSPFNSVSSLSLYLMYHPFASFSNIRFTITEHLSSKSRNNVIIFITVLSYVTKYWS